MSNQKFCRAFTVAILLIFLFQNVRSLHAQSTFAPDGMARKKIAFPVGVEEWLNTPPISLDQVRGKGIVLWFFEEGCPRCMAKWPELYALEQKLRDLPVQFVAVNSGTSRRDLVTYLQRVNCKWPVVCDTQRKFERSCSVPEISLNNIMQCYYISPDGSLQTGNWSDIEGAAVSASRGAVWNIAPSAYPESLRDVVRNIEFGNYPIAISRLKDEYRKTTNKTDFKFLIDTIKKHAAKEAQRVEQLIDEKEPLSSYRAIVTHEKRFDGMPLSKVLATAKVALSNTSEVKQTLANSASLQ